MSKKTLQEFIGHVKNSGLVLGSHFYIEIYNKYLLDLNADLVGMYCESVNLPGINIATTDVRIFGENRTSAYMPLYPDLTLTFLVDADMKVKNFFDLWTYTIIDRQTRNVGYYNDYINDLRIYVTDKMGKTLYSVVAKEVFPKAVSDIRLDSGARDVVKLDVTFALKYWEVDQEGTGLGGVEILEPKEPDFFGIRGGRTEMPGVYGGNFSSIITSSAAAYTSDSQRAGKALSALTATGPLSQFGQTMNNIGQFTNKLSTAMTGFSQGLSNITAPIAAVSTSLAGMSSLMGTLNTVTSSLGLGTPFAGAQAALVKASGTMAAVSTVRGLPGAISSVGSSVGSVGTTMGSIIPSIGTASNGSKQVMDSLKQMGDAFKGYGGKTQEAAGALQSQINRGEY